MPFLRWAEEVKQREEATVEGRINRQPEQSSTDESKSLRKHRVTPTCSRPFNRYASAEPDGI